MKRDQQMPRIIADHHSNFKIRKDATQKWNRWWTTQKGKGKKSLTKNVIIKYLWLKIFCITLRVKKIMGMNENVRIRGRLAECVDFRCHYIECGGLDWRLKWSCQRNSNTPRNRIPIIQDHRATYVHSWHLYCPLQKKPPKSLEIKEFLDFPFSFQIQNKKRKDYKRLTSIKKLFVLRCFLLWCRFASLKWNQEKGNINDS